MYLEVLSFFNMSRSNRRAEHVTEVFMCSDKRICPKNFGVGGNHAKEHKLQWKEFSCLPFYMALVGLKWRGNQQFQLNLVFKDISGWWFNNVWPIMLYWFYIKYLCDISYETDNMICRNRQNWNNFTKMLSKLSAKDIKVATQNTESSMNNDIQHIVKSITTKCKSLCHISKSKAAQDAQKLQLTMMDYVGLHTSFLAIMPHNKCSFRVRLYADPNTLVGDPQIKIKIWWQKFELTQT